MIGPVIFVKLSGKMTTGKAFLLALLNWLFIYSIFISVYYSIFPGDIDATINSAPALWFFVSWRYMIEKNTTIKTKPIEFKEKKRKIKTFNKCGSS